LLKSPIPRAVLLASICFLAVIPFFWHGTPSGHDFEFHMFSWMEVHHQWTQGIVYPRWAALSHWGYGEARFLFYPPASWSMGSALGSILPWVTVPATYIWLALLLSGLSMFQLARRWLSPADAFFAAVFYAVNPYHLIIVYWRSAYAELLAAALLPLLLLCLLRIGERGWRPVLRLGLILAAAWLTNAPAAVMIHYSVAGLAVVIAVLDRSWRPLVRTASAIALGAGLAAFYLVPAVYEEKWVNIAQVLAPGVRPQDNFLFAIIRDPDHNRFNALVSWVAICEVAAFAVATLLSRHWWRTQRKLWTVLAAWAGFAALIMFAITAPLWNVLPELRFIQLPWRWLLCLNAALAMLLTMAIRRWSLRALACGVLLTTVVCAGYRIQHPWWDTAAEIRKMSASVANGTGYEGTDEYVPAGADAYDVDKKMARVVDSAGAPARLTDVEWGIVEKRFVVHSDKAELLTLRLFNYPAWDLTINGEEVETETSDEAGQMQIPVKPGRNDIRLHFARTQDRTVGGIVSLVSLVLMIMLLFLTRLPKSRTAQA
jgi:6-pyruvoyl-tetrahydropterin synthase-like protein